MSRINTATRRRKAHEVPVGLAEDYFPDGSIPETDRQHSIASIQLQQAPAMPADIDPILSKRQVSDWLGVHISTIDRWCAAGTFVAKTKLGQSRIGWSRAAVQEWLANR